MPNEPNPEQRQRGAFQLLRDEARASHREGDGLRVGHLCEIAFQEIQRLEKDGPLLLSLTELQWVFIFEYYWLLHTHTIRVTREILRNIQRRSASDAAVAQALECYSYLIEQPLSGHDLAFEKLNAVPIEAFANEATSESTELAIHLLELAWFRSASMDTWVKLLQRWQQTGPEWMRDLLPPVQTRLHAQTRLTCADDSHPPFDETSGGELRAIAPIAELWLLQLCGRSREVVERINEFSPRLRSDAYDWRLFADFWHTGLFLAERQTRGEDSQGVWLARRRTMTTDYPLLVFQDQRELRIENKIAELFRERKEAGASRWEILTLAMLHELAALRLWDFGMWRQALVAQSETLLEAAQWRNADVRLTECGLQLAIRASVAKTARNDFLTRDAVRVLEFAPSEIYSSLATAILNTYSWQKHAAGDLLTDIADLLPETTWPRLARWTASYVDDMQSRRTAGWRFNALEFWNDLLPSVENDSEVWGSLKQAVLALARIAHAWYGDPRQLIFTWLVWAPLAAADEVAEVIKSVSAQATDSFNRAKLLCDAEIERGVEGRWTTALYSNASNPAERLLLARHLKISNIDSIENTFRTHIEDLIRQAVVNAMPPPDAQQFQFGPQAVSTYLVKQWRTSDLPLLQDIVAAIDSPKTLREWLPFLLNTAQLMVFNGPIEFANTVQPYVERWLNDPPIGRLIPFGGAGAFASIHITGNLDSAITNALGWLAFQLRRKLHDRGANDLFAWVTRVITSNEIACYPLALHACIVLASNPVTIELNMLMSTTRSILLVLCNSARDAANDSYHLAEALNYLAFDFARQTSELIDWSSARGEYALRELLNIIKDALSFLYTFPDPVVRNQVAFALANLTRWHGSDPDLLNALQRLARDNRAKVRLAARGGWLLAKQRDNSIKSSEAREVKPGL